MGERGGEQEGEEEEGGEVSGALFPPGPPGMCTLSAVAPTARFSPGAFLTSDLATTF